LIEGLVLAQSAVVYLIVYLIDTYSEFLKVAPKMIDYWYNIFSELCIRTTTITENQKRDKVKVE
jgi:hypothetical protein